MSTDTCYNMDDPSKCYAKWKKADAEVHMLYDSIYVKGRNGQPIRTESRSVVA